jgi:hypothetical protein
VHVARFDQASFASSEDSTDPGDDGGLSAGGQFLQESSESDASLMTFDSARDLENFLESDSERCA